MAEDKVYTRVCKNCGVKFETGKARASVCNDCKKVTKLRLARERYDDFKKPNAERKVNTGRSVNDFVLIVEEYNVTHNTDYSYGEFESALNTGKIKRHELFD